MLQTGGRGERRKRFSYRWGPLARRAASAPPVSVPAATAAPPAAMAPTTTPRRLAIMVPVPVAVSVGALVAVPLAGHVSVVSFPRVEPVVQTAGFQVMPKWKQRQTKTTCIKPCMSTVKAPFTCLRLSSVMKTYISGNEPAYSLTLYPWSLLYNACN